MANWLNQIFGVNLKTVFCPDCGQEQPKIRRPNNFREAMIGGNTCKNCACQMDKFGQKIQKKS